MIRFNMHLMMLYDLYQVLYDNLVSSKGYYGFWKEMNNIVMQEASYGNIYDISDFSSEVTREEVIISCSIVEWREKLEQYFNVSRDFILKNKAIPYLTKDLIEKNDINTLGKYIKRVLLDSIASDIFSKIITNNRSINVGELS